jgi:hypothetical protein
MNNMPCISKLYFHTLVKLNNQYQFYLSRNPMNYQNKAKIISFFLISSTLISCGSVPVNLQSAKKMLWTIMNPENIQMI